MKVSNYFILTIVLLSVFACKKETPIYPVITITSPSDTTLFSIGDTVFIEGTVIDGKGLHEVFLTVTNTADDSVYLFAHPYVHNLKSCSFKDTLITTTPSVYKLTIEALDHDLNLSKKEIPISVN